jgi:hypothetical protein
MKHISEHASLPACLPLDWPVLMALVLSRLCVERWLLAGGLRGCSRS